MFVETMFNKLTLIVIAGSCLIAGCNSGVPEATAEQKKSFEGGPMPESFRKDLEARRAASVREAAAKAAQQKH